MTIQVQAIKEQVYWNERKNKIENLNKKKVKQGKTQRRNIAIIRDAILNGLVATGVQKDHNVKVGARSGATIRDMIKHINPVARKRPLLLLHIQKQMT